MEMKRYLSYVYKIIKVYLKETKESTVRAYRTLIPHTHTHKKKSFDQYQGRS